MSAGHSGYLSSQYAAALAEIGSPRALPRSGGWLLERDIPGTDLRDAAGCYPMFACKHWDALDADLRDLRDVSKGLVSVALVTDPFGDYDAATLARAFPDRCIAYKEHFVTDLRRPEDALIARHHRRSVSRARRVVDVEVCARPAEYLGDWLALYSHLSRRHNITGAAAFSRESFAKQMEVPGLVALRAIHHGQTVGMTLWYEHGDVGYYHLGAYSDAGYEHRAAFAIFAAAIDFFRGRVGWLALGAGAGVVNDGEDGLTRFKRGWSTGTRTVYFCGRILDKARYAALVNAAASGCGVESGEFFPAYRAGAVAFPNDHAPVRGEGART